jgi:hypothetical protein
MSRRAYHAETGELLPLMGKIRHAQRSALAIEHVILLQRGHQTPFPRLDGAAAPGKSTLARRIADELSIPLISLDAIDHDGVFGVEKA